MKPRRFKRDGATYRYDSDKVQAIMFGAKGKCFWAWAVWGHRSNADGVEFSLKAARQKATAAIERVEQPDPERKP
jgi:hypothetical protein